MLDFTYDPPSRNPGKPWKWIILDSLIISGISFTATLPEHIPNITELYIALKSFFYSFLLQVAVERGLKPYMSRNGKNGRAE
ncbi:MAG: hypothetical protein QXN17_02405 [Nitrososphaerota archaeon]